MHAASTRRFPNTTNHADTHFRAIPLTEQQAFALQAVRSFVRVSTPSNADNANPEMLADPRTGDHARVEDNTHLKEPTNIRITQIGPAPCRAGTGSSGAGQSSGSQAGDGHAQL